MSAADSKAVFLSYASQDAAAVQRLCDALRAAGVEVWFDQNELVGGDAWDAKIRKQIAECALFVPVISANTNARGEGYFRLEWKLAVDRSHLMAHDQPFLLPVVIDATADAAARVPPEFRAVQWTRLRPVDSGGQARQEPAIEVFCERVKSLLLSGAGASAVAGVADPGVKAPGSLPASPRPATIDPAGRRPWLVPAIVALAAVGAVAFWQPWKSPRPSAAADPKSALADQKSVAVLAFANMSADKDAEYFSDGVSEEILNALANNPALLVAGRTSSFSFKGKNATHGEIGRALNVARVIEGSVRKAGNRVRITVQLINAADSKVLWSEPFDRDLTDIFAVQSEIARTVAQKLAGGPSNPVPAVTVAAGAETKNLAAYDAYLRGRALQTGGMSRANAFEMLRLYQEAVRFDPNYALAWARLSQAYSRIRTGGRDRSEQNALEATNAATTSLRLARALPEAHLAMASVHLSVDYDMDAAQRELDETERLRPNDAEVPTYRVSLAEARGHWGDSLARLIARAADRDPQNADHIYLLGRKLSLIGRYAEAEAMYERAMAISPTGSHNRRLAQNYVAWTGDIARASAIYDAAPPSELVVMRWDRARLRAMHGDIPGAITDFEKAFGDATNPAWMRGYAAYYAAQLEQRRNNASRAKELFGTALSAARQSLVELPDDEVSASLLALVHAARGERSDAVAALEEAMRLAARTNNAMNISERRVERAEALMLLGDADAAIAELRAVHEMGRAFGYRLRRDVEWEPLRTNPKFQQLMKQAEARADAQPRPKK